MSERKSRLKNNFPEKLSCAVCGKKIQDIAVLTELTIDVSSWYVNNSKKKLENINGLWKKNAEYFCEKCFGNYVKAIQKFHADNRK